LREKKSLQKLIAAIEEKSGSKREKKRLEDKKLPSILRKRLALNILRRRYSSW
jgi:hypothetical protein